MGRKLFTYVIMLMLTTVAICGTVACEEENISSGMVHVSRAKGYTNIEDMATDSQLIIIGVVKSVLETKQESEHLYITNFLLQPETVLKGNIDKEIIIRQAGTYDKPWTSVTDDPLFQTGERYLLFLNSNTFGTYFYYGPNARYKIADSKVYSMNHVLQDDEYSAPEALDFNGVNLDDIIDDIIETLDTVRFMCPASTILLSGETGREEFVLATGKHGQGEVSYTLSRVSSRESGDQIPMPEGMTVSIEPAEFVASPYNDYRSVVTIKTEEQVITPGEYWISVEFSIGGITSGQHVLRVVIDEKKLSEIETRP